jgi:hypothetical protein
MAQRLNVAVALLRQIVAFDIELQCAAKGDIEYLKPLANGEDRQSALERFLHGGKFPAVALRINLFIQERRIENFLAQKFWRNIGTAGEQETIHLVQANISISRVPDFDFGMLTENRAKPFCIFRSYPRSEVGHEAICDVEPLVPSACLPMPSKTVMTAARTR